MKGQEIKSGDLLGIAVVVVVRLYVRSGKCVRYLLSTPKSFSSLVLLTSDFEKDGLSTSITRNPPNMLATLNLFKRWDNWSVSLPCPILICIIHI